VVGASLGGLHALQVLTGSLPTDFSLPIAVVQHRFKGSDDTLCRMLQKYSKLPVEDAEDKTVVLSGRVYLAPADYHLLMEENTFSLSTEGPVSGGRPSVDVLFESAAAAYGAGVVGVVLTGANHDGSGGAATIKAHGGIVIVQDPRSAESPFMPNATIEAIDVDHVLPLDEIGPFLASLASGSEKRWGNSV